MLAACSFFTKETPTQVFSCKFCETFKNILKNWSSGRDWRKIFEANLAYLLRIKVSGSSLKVFLEQHYLKAAKHCNNDKSHWLNQKKRECRKRNATYYKPTRKDFEFLYLLETSSESELLSDNDLLTWYVFWICNLKS